MILRATLASFLILLATCAHAGQGPQNVLVVMNQRSWASLAVGNEYARLRNIPAVNLVYLDWEGSTVQTDVETFRERILKPILQAIEARKLTQQITTVAYSADFPYLIDFHGDLKDDSPVDPTARRFHQGSLTGMTYLGGLVLAKEVRYSNLGVNFYYRPSLEDKLLVPTRAFEPIGNWTPQGELDEASGVRYLMSTMLAYTSGRGNSLAEVEHYLAQSASADGLYPAGKVYFLQNGDIRARTREPQFRFAIKKLAELGVAGEVVEGVLPRERGDVMGAMIGTVDYRWSDAQSFVRPGAICENLTSFGGILRENGGQTALSECLRAGAAASSGTVTEPYAIQAKFPHPMLHVHYAQGCSLAEAFYQAVQGPYQLLIVGDPLCRPWATIPTVSASGLPANSQVSGMLTLTPSAVTVPGKSVGRFELYVDGQRAADCRPGETLQVDSRQWADGWHELRIVGYEDSLIATQDDLILSVLSNNHGWPEVTLTADARQVPLNGEVTLRAESPSGGNLMLIQHQRVLGTVAAERGEWKIPASTLGMGRVKLQVVASRGTGAEHLAISQPLVIDVLPPEHSIEPQSIGGELQAGLKLTRADGATAVVERLADNWLDAAGVKPGESFTLSSIFTADETALYQFQLEFSGELELSINGVTLWKGQESSPGWRYVPVQLPAGRHRLTIQGTLADKRLNVALGRTGTQIIAGERFQHEK